MIGAPIQRRIKDFWNEIIAKLPPEYYLDSFSAEMLRMVAKGMLPHIELSPASAASKMILSSVSAFLPRRFFTDLKAALEEHIDFAELPNLVEPDSPVLLLGAANVRSGELKKFNSRLGEIRVEAILASAAIPTLFPAVQVGEDFYWDGLFSDNPPVKELMRVHFMGPNNIPDEIWVIQINPTAVESVPETSTEIVDRRNQMMGNVSLLQSLEFVEFCNMLIREKAVDFGVLERAGFSRREPITVRTIQMSPDLQSTLDYVSKLSREPSHIHRLIEDGERRGSQFLESLSLAGAGIS